MVDKWMTPQQAADALHCTPEVVRTMLRAGLLAGEKVGGEWRLKTTEVERFQHAGEQDLKVDPGMVEASMALAGIAAAIAALLPGIEGTAEVLRVCLAVLSGILAVFSAYSALWLLARYCLEGSSLLGLEEIWTLLTSPMRLGPHWLVAVGLLIWLMLSAVIGVAAVGG